MHFRLSFDQNSVSFDSLFDGTSGRPNSPGVSSFWLFSNLLIYSAFLASKAWFLRFHCGFFFSVEAVRLKEPTNRSGQGVIRRDNLFADAHKRKPQILSISFTVSKISGNLALIANLQIKKSVWIDKEYSKDDEKLSYFFDYILNFAYHGPWSHYFTNT